MKTGWRNVLIVGIVVLLIAAAFFLPEFLISVSERGLAGTIREKDASEYLLEKTEEDLLKKLEILSRDNTMRMILSIPEGEERGIAERTAYGELEKLAEYGAFSLSGMRGPYDPDLFHHAEELDFSSVVLMSAFSVSDGSSFTYYELLDSTYDAVVLLDREEGKILSVSFQGGGFRDEFTQALETWLEFDRENGGTGEAEFAESLSKGWAAYYGAETENAEIHKWKEEEWKAYTLFQTGGLPDAKTGTGGDAVRIPIASFDLVRENVRVSFPVVYEILSDQKSALRFGPAG